MHPSAPFFLFFLYYHLPLRDNNTEKGTLRYTPALWRWRITDLCGRDWPTTAPPRTGSGVSIGEVSPPPQEHVEHGFESVGRGWGSISTAWRRTRPAGVAADPERLGGQGVPRSRPFQERCMRAEAKALAGEWDQGVAAMLGAPTCPLGNRRSALLRVPYPLFLQFLHHPLHHQRLHNATHLTWRTSRKHAPSLRHGRGLFDH